MYSALWSSHCIGGGKGGAGGASAPPLFSEKPVNIINTYTFILGAECMLPSPLHCWYVMWIWSNSLKPLHANRPMQNTTHAAFSYHPQGPGQHISEFQEYYSLYHLLQTCQVTLILRVRPAFWQVNQHSLAENLN